MDILGLVFVTLISSTPVTGPIFLAWIGRGEKLTWSDHGGLLLMLVIYSGIMSFTIRPKFEAILVAGEPTLRNITDEGEAGIACFITAYVSYLIAAKLFADSD